jgi:integrase
LVRRGTKLSVASVQYWGYCWGYRVFFGSSFGGIDYRRCRGLWLHAANLEAQRAMRLSDAKVKGLKPKAAAYKVSDGQGLYVQVAPSGKRLWRYKYRFAGKEKLLALGAFPEVSLRQARERLAQARSAVADGSDPSEVKKTAKAQAQAVANTFETVASEWLEKFSADWAAITRSQAQRRFARLVFPIIGSKPIEELSPLDVLAVLRPIEADGNLETAHRVRQRISEVFRYAVATGRAQRDVTADLRGAIPAPKVEHLAAIIEPTKLAALLRAIDAYDGSSMVKAALQLAPLLFVRPGELRHAEWSEIDWTAREWTIAAAKMKMRIAHTVPLCRQALVILRALQQDTGSGQFCLTNGRSAERAMTDAAVNAALRRLGYEKGEITGHGFRATARTLLDEVLGEPPHIIEQQLAHAVRDPLGRAYNRTKHLPQRREMMQRWADYLDGLKAGNVVPFPKAAVG